MSDYISREETVKQITRVAEQIKGDNSPYIFTALYLGNKEDFPSADVRKNIHGEWIKIQSGDKDFPESIVCSKCKNENSHLDFNERNEPIGKVFVKSNFCPNCGADMRTYNGYTVSNEYVDYQDRVGADMRGEK